jgi:hypothetical protein
MILHAGSMYKNTLTLYGGKTPVIIFFEDGKTEKNIQWALYCRISRKKRRRMCNWFWQGKIQL